MRYVLDEKVQRKNVMKLLAELIVIWLLVICFSVTVMWYLGLPIVAKDSQGNCVWIDKTGDKEPCPDTLPRKYHDITVDPNNGK
tara:strand:- start:4571 stop:4822 length:252 start_codon:yes stop_codon:yes gene_type:complete